MGSLEGVHGKYGLLRAGLDGEQTGFLKVDHEGAGWGSGFERLHLLNEGH